MCKLQIYIFDPLFLPENLVERQKRCQEERLWDFNETITEYCWQLWLSQLNECERKMCPDRHLRLSAYPEKVTIHIEYVLLMRNKERLSMAMDAVI